MLICQQFQDSKSDETKSKGSKCQWLNTRDNKKGEDLNKFESEDMRKDIIYIPFPFVAHPQKESNCSTNMSKGTR